MVGAESPTTNWAVKRHDCIPLYLPNLVGYLRIICTTVAIALAFTHPRLMLIFYFVSFVCDELDGRLARMFGQMSTYGAVLDMVTDRLSTAALLGILAVLYPSRSQLCVMLQALDIASHWCHMYFSLVSAGTSHKALESHRNWLVRSYYANRIFMGTCCISCEVLYLSVYAMHWPVFRDIFVTTTSFRNLSSFIKAPGPLLGAGSGVDVSPGLPGVSVVLLVAELAIPGFVIKQTINVIQLIHAMRGLWMHDLKRS